MRARTRRGAEDRAAGTAAPLEAACRYDRGVRDDADETAWEQIEIFDALVADAEAGAARPLREYLARFAGREEAVAEAWARLHRPEAGARADRRERADLLGPYVVKRELGRGGQAVVYLAEDPRVGRMVAL